MKKILIIMCMLLLTGCTVKGNITMNYDGSVKEEVSILGKNEVLNTSKSNFKEIVDNKIEKYSPILDFKKYNYDYVQGNEMSGAKVYKSYDNICAYFGNSAVNQYVYKYMDCTENEYYYEIKNATEYIPYCPQCGEWPALNDIEFKITLPVSAEEQNADEINGNTYIWKYDKNTTDKNFYLKISKSSLIEYEEEYIKEIKSKENVKKGLIIGVVALIILTLVVISLILYKKYQKNKLDY